jgi:hypothetical protein
VCHDDQEDDQVITADQVDEVRAASLVPDEDRLIYVGRSTLPGKAPLAWWHRSGDRRLILRPDPNARLFPEEFSISGDGKVSPVRVAGHFEVTTDPGQPPNVVTLRDTVHGRDLARVMLP